MAVNYEISPRMLLLSARKKTYLSHQKNRWSRETYLGFDNERDLHMYTVLGDFSFAIEFDLLILDPSGSNVFESFMRASNAHLDCIIKALPRRRLDFSDACDRHWHILLIQTIFPIWLTNSFDSPNPEWIIPLGGRRARNLTRSVYATLLDKIPRLRLLPACGQDDIPETFYRPA